VYRLIFTSWVYPLFLVTVLIAYWSIRSRCGQNLLLLAASYLFYGWIHPWFCILIAVSTVVDYLCARGMARYPERRRSLLVVSLVVNLGMLGAFKYFNFFVDSFCAAFLALGIELSPLTLEVYLPVGISFYTFQTLSYTIDVYRGRCSWRRSFVDFALFVSFFPQLVAGPIERARRFLPQIEAQRRWSWLRFADAWPLLIWGYLKKVVIADNVATLVDRVFMLEQPSCAVLAVGTLAFAVQIYCDFAAYTDIARGSAKLLGFDLVENFDSPYLAISPSDFWRRWHISFSSWIRDYLYIGLGGSRVASRGRFALVLLVTMGLSGLWHGAAWNFVLWGLYHGMLVFCYHQLGMGGRWTPSGRRQWLLAWSVMFSFTLFGWLLFRAPSIGWLGGVLPSLTLGLSGDSLVTALAFGFYIALYCTPLWVKWMADRHLPPHHPLRGALHGCAMVVILIFAREAGRDFIYFRF
jgi:D-alanyl-lipoteichoic acid acyltransferase DltB (MBOAT superfamily)